MPAGTTPFLRRVAGDVVGSGSAMPIHWGTYSPRRGRRGEPPWLDRPLEEFRAALAGLGLEDRLVALRPGE